MGHKHRHIFQACPPPNEETSGRVACAHTGSHEQISLVWYTFDNKNATFLFCNNIVRNQGNITPSEKISDVNVFVEEVTKSNNLITEKENILEINQNNEIRTKTKI